MTTPAFETAHPGGDATIPRDRWGRPLIPPRGGGKPQPYTRVTTLAGTLDDTRNLMQWHGRMVALGLAQRPDLLALASTTSPDDKQVLNGIAEDAAAAAGSRSSANVGTALHTYMERIDTGQPLGVVPAELKPPLRGYVELRKAHGFNVLACELFLAHEGLQVAGTTDAIIEMGGQRFIADRKTGSSVDYSARSIAVQLACYAGGTRYSAEGGWADESLVDEYGVSQEVAWVIHVPQDGGGQAWLRPVDIAAGRKAAQVAKWVREWRKAKPIGAA